MKMLNHLYRKWAVKIMQAFGNLLVGSVWKYMPLIKIDMDFKYYLTTRLLRKKSFRLKVVPN